jgi:hypothetical protein
MSEYDFIDVAASKVALAQRSAEQSVEPSQQGPGLAVQREATDQVVCRAGDASCAKAHAATVSRSAVSRSLLRLQRQYGNRYAREVLHLARQSEPDAEAGPAVERAIEGARGGGQALDSTVRHRMEPSFGADFSGVRIHTDARADDLNHSLNAKAFATGQDIFFRQGAYSPGTSSGRELLAHELTHVVQQNGETVHRQMTVSQPGDRHEVEADRMANAVMQQEHQAEPKRADRYVIDRQAPEDERPLQTRSDESALQRQPEAPKTKDDEEEKKKLHAKLEGQATARQVDAEQRP